MNVLVLGGSGLLGSDFIETYSSEFYITALINKTKIKNKNIKKIGLEKLSYQRLHQIVIRTKPQVIFNYAGITSVEKCEYNKKEASKINIQLPLYLAKISKKFKIKLIHISTDHFYKNFKKKYTEKDKLILVNYYAFSKAVSEKKIMQINKKAIIVRTNFFCWSLSKKLSFSDFIISNLRNKNKIELFNDVYFTPIITSELFTIILKLIKKDLSGIYNICSNKRISKYQFGCLIAKIFKLQMKLIVPISIKDKNLTDRPNEMGLSNLKLKRKAKIKVSSINNQLHILKQNEI